MLTSLADGSIVAGQRDAAGKEAALASFGQDRLLSSKSPRWTAP
jgi:hypothetical protein